MTKKTIEELRTYGLPNSNAIGIPNWEKTDMECPNCKSLLCVVSVRVEQSLLVGGVGTSTYLGCPACPYASPAMNVADSGAQASIRKP